MATTKNKNLGMTVGTGTVPNALAAIKAELKGLKQITESQYKTEGRVDGFDKSIQDETKVENLVRMHSSIFGKANAYNNSVSEIAKAIPGGKFEVPVFKMNNSTPEAYQEDIALRIQVLNVTERKQTLEALLKEAEQFLTKQDQLQMFLGKLESMTGVVVEAPADTETEGDFVDADVQA